MSVLDICTFFNAAAFPPPPRLSRLIPLKRATPQTSQTRTAPRNQSGREVAGFTGLRPFCPRNMDANAVTTRGVKAGEETAFRVSVCVVRCRGGGKVRRGFYSLSAAARGGDGDARGIASVLLRRFALIVRVQTVSTRSLSRGGRAWGASPRPRNPFDSFDTRHNSFGILSQASDGGLSALRPLPWGSSPS